MLCNDHNVNNGVGLHLGVSWLEGLNGHLARLEIIELDVLTGLDLGNHILKSSILVDLYLELLGVLNGHGGTDAGHFKTSSWTIANKVPQLAGWKDEASIAISSQFSFNCIGVNDVVAFVWLEKACTYDLLFLVAQVFWQVKLDKADQVHRNGHGQS